MAIPQEKVPLTEEQYLAIERAAEFKSEFHGGEMFAMSGGSFEHSLIITNILGELRVRLKGRPCAPFESNLRLKITSSGLYTYPDAMVICGPPEFVDGHRDMVVNPTVIVEVLSPSSEAYDRGKKFEDYRTLASLKDYVLISQTHAAVEVYSRTDDGRWILSPFQGMDAVARIASIEVDLKLNEVYDRLDFGSRRDAPQDSVR